MKLNFIKCSDMIDVRDGTHESPKYVSNGFPLITSKNIKENKIDFEDVNYISLEDYEKINKRSKVEKGDILMPMIGTIGNPVIVDDNGFAIKNVALFKLSDNNNLDSKYFYYFLKSDIALRQLQKNKRGGTQAFVSLGNLRDLEFPIIELPKQERIAEILDKSQALIDNRKKQIEELDLLVKSKFIEMFGDPITNSKGLEIKNFEEVIILQRGYDLPTYARDTNGKYDVWGANGVLAKHSEYKVEEFGVITGRSGSLGNVYYTKEPYWPLNTTLFSKNTFGNNVVYLTYLLRFYDLKRFSNGTGVPTLNRNLLNGQKIIDVPIEFQNQFADFVEQVNKLKFEMEKSLKELEDNFNSLMQKAFKGEIFN